MIPAKSATVAALDRLPWTAELYQRYRARGAPPATGYRLDRLIEALPGWADAARTHRLSLEPGHMKNVLVFACLSWWIEHGVLLGLMLATAGHRVTLVTLPYRRWTVDPPGFDLRRQRVYLEDALRPASPMVVIGNLAQRSVAELPSGLSDVLERQALLDVQYTLQREDAAWEQDAEARALFALRLRRNRAAAAGALSWMERSESDAVVVPNGSILEFGAVFHAARARRIHVSTYEFGEQRERLWLAQDAQVMRQDTTALWQSRGLTPLTEAEREGLRGMYAARRVGASWANFARQWQSGESEGAAAARARLGLDPSRPVVLICTNVVGDSLALDRQVFTTGMSEWLAATVRRLAGRSEAQVVVRVHPGEMLGAGHPSQDIVRSSLPLLPENIHLVPPDSPVNTYDLIELADLGLVYTTTVGLEMAMAGVPVLVAGATHYRGKGFTSDPDTWEEYFATLDGWLADPAAARLGPAQVELAQRYAYRFFFEFPFPYPWHLIGFWDDVRLRPPQDVFRAENLSAYERTISAMVGEPVFWGTGP